MTEKAAFKELVASWAKRLNVRPRQVRIQNMSKKWGSCSTQGYLSFASNLLDERSDFQEYVVVHELLHLRIPNHGKLFDSTLKAHFPNGSVFMNNLRGRTLSSAFNGSRASAYLRGKISGRPT